MIPNKVVFYTRPVEVHFHLELAKRLKGHYDNPKIVFASFFSQAIDLANRQGFETLYFPRALRESRGRLISETRIQEIDQFCGKVFFGINSMLQMERFLPRKREEARLFMLEHLTVLDELVAVNTLGISSMYDHFVYLAGGMLAFEKKGAHFAFVGCGVPSGRVNALKKPNELWKNLKSAENRINLYDKVIEELLLPPEERISYMKPLKTRRPISVSERIQVARERAAYGKKDYTEGSYFARMQMNWMQNAVFWRFKAWRERLRDADHWDIREASDLDTIQSPCVFLALHMEPEATILMYSPRLRCQIEACRLVAEALPVGFTLLVKENPKMLGKRDPGYYEAIKRFPNVLLCSTSISSVQLIEKAEAVISLGGTVTIEARLRGKKAFCFGYPPFWRMATAAGHCILDELKVLNGESSTRSCKLEAEDPAWTDWIKGNFKGATSKTEFSPEFGQFVRDSGSENISAYCSFITDCLEEEGKESNED